MIRLFGITQPCVAGIVFSVDILQLRVTAQHFGRKEFIDCLAGTGHIMIHLLDVDNQSIAYYLSCRKGHNSAVFTTEHSSLEGIFTVMAQHVGALASLVFGHNLVGVGRQSGKKGVGIGESFSFERLKSPMGVIGHETVHMIALLVVMLSGKSGEVCGRVDIVGPIVERCHLTAA